MRSSRIIIGKSCKDKSDFTVVWVPSIDRKCACGWNEVSNREKWCDCLGSHVSTYILVVWRILIIEARMNMVLGLRWSFMVAIRVIFSMLNRLVGNGRSLIVAGHWITEVVIQLSSKQLKHRWHAKPWGPSSSSAVRTGGPVDIEPKTGTLFLCLICCRPNTEFSHCDVLAKIGEKIGISGVSG